MKIIILAFFAAFLMACNAAPVKMSMSRESRGEQRDENIDWQKLNYEHYLNQVMQELEKDEKFQKRVTEMRKNGSVKAEDLATQLTFAKHSVRTRLDELKRMELKRLSELERRLDMLKAQRGDKDVPEEIKRMIDRQHVDHDNPKTFEIDDLQRLIQRAITDLKLIDEKQKEEFKRHEMEKEVLHRRKMKHIKNDTARKEEEKKWEESKERHNKHEKIHAPGSEAQLKDVWEKEDHMDPANFEPHTFFKMHDLNEDGVLDENEIETLFQNELDKAYNANDPDDDMQERYESMMEMRKNIMDKIDTNKDLRISFEELKNWTKSPEFKKDEGFKLPEEDRNKLFTPDDYKRFEQDYDKEHPDEGDEDHEEDKPHSEPKGTHHVEVPKKDPGRKARQQAPGHL